jgi:hypothetical protein
MQHCAGCCGFHRCRKAALVEPVEHSRLREAAAAVPVGAVRNVVAIEEKEIGSRQCGSEGNTLRCDRMLVNCQPAKI